jgi:hypothetical protein
VQSTTHSERVPPAMIDDNYSSAPLRDYGAPPSFMPRSFRFNPTAAEFVPRTESRDTSNECTTSTTTAQIQVVCDTRVVCAQPTAMERAERSNQYTNLRGKLVAHMRVHICRASDRPADSGNVRMHDMQRADRSFTLGVVVSEVLCCLSFSSTL